MALDVFTEGTAEVDVLRNLAVHAKDRNSPEESNALCRAAVVLLVSHFESFLKTVAIEFVDGVGTGQLESRRIPRGLRETHTIPHLQEILSSRDDNQRSALLKRLRDVATLWTEDAKPPAGALNAQVFSRIITSANTDVIDDLYSRMGNFNSVCVGDIEIESDDGETITKDIRWGLKDVVGCRNDIAHGSTERKPTPNDVARYSRFLRAFSERLERKAATLLEQIATHGS